MFRLIAWKLAAIAAAQTCVARASPAFPSETPVALMVTREVSARTSRVGDLFPLEVTAAVVLVSGVQIPAGALAWGEVVKAEPAGRGGRGGRIAIRLLHIETSQGRITIDGTSAAERLNSSRDISALSASVGPFALLAKGHDARLKAGEIITGFIPPRANLRDTNSDRDVVLSADTPIELVTVDVLSSETAVRGDSFKMTVGRDVRVGERIVIPKGTSAYGVVTVVDRKAAFGSGARLTVTVSYIELDGRVVRIRGEQTSEGRNAPARGLAQSAFTGAIAVALTGKSAKIEAGTRLSARLRQDERFPTAQ